MGFPEVLIFALIGAVVAVSLSLVVAVGRRRKGLIECAVRAEQPGPHLPAGKWRHGTATGAPGVLRFTPGGPAGLRFPRGEPFDIPVTAAWVQESRRPSLRQLWSINPLLHIALVRTPHGDLELAAPRGSLTDLLHAVQRS
jgi:hypothetical protein